MAINPKDLTISSRELLGASTFGERAVTRAGRAPSLLSALTPTELASGFPEYVKRGGLAGAMSRGGKGMTPPEHAQKAREDATERLAAPYKRAMERRSVVGGTRPSSTQVEHKLTEEQKKTLREMRDSPIAINSPKAEFILKIPKDELSKYGIETVTGNDGIPQFKATATTASKMSNEEIIEESRKSKSHAELIAKTTLLGETGKKDFIIFDGKGGTGPIEQIAPDTKGSKSYGWLGVNSGFGNNAGRGSASIFAKENSEFGLTATPGTPEFDKQWKAAAKKDPQAFHEAQLKYYEKHILGPTKSALEKAGLSQDAIKDPRILSFIGDRAIQHGQRLALDVDNDAMKNAWKNSGGDIKKFMENMNNYDRQILSERFKNAIASGKYGVTGSEERLRKRIGQAMSLTPEQIVKYANLGPNPTEEEINQYRQKLINAEINQQENKLAQRLGVLGQTQQEQQVQLGDGIPGTVQKVQEPGQILSPQGSHQIDQSGYIQPKDRELYSARNARECATLVKGFVPSVGRAGAWKVQSPNSIVPGAPVATTAYRDGTGGKRGGLYHSGIALTSPDKNGNFYILDQFAGSSGKPNVRRVNVNHLGNNRGVTWGAIGNANGQRSIDAIDHALSLVNPDKNPELAKELKNNKEQVLALEEQNKIEESKVSTAQQPPVAQQPTQIAGPIPTSESTAEPSQKEWENIARQENVAKPINVPQEFLTPQSMSDSLKPVPAEQPAAPPTAPPEPAAQAPQPPAATPEANNAVGGTISTVGAGKDDLKLITPRKTHNIGSNESYSKLGTDIRVTPKQRVNAEASLKQETSESRREQNIPQMEPRGPDQTMPNRNKTEEMLTMARQAIAQSPSDNFSNISGQRYANLVNFREPIGSDGGRYSRGPKTINAA